tara:strand:- start:4369 stop:4722 length:354 start_codon:yes stop_codon:yes gene_type:complete
MGGKDICWNKRLSDVSEPLFSPGRSKRNTPLLRIQHDPYTPVLATSFLFAYLMSGETLLTITQRGFDKMDCLACPIPKITHSPAADVPALFNPKRSRETASKKGISGTQHEKIIFLL